MKRFKRVNIDVDGYTKVYVVCYVKTSGPFIGYTKDTDIEKKDYIKVSGIAQLLRVNDEVFLDEVAARERLRILRENAIKSLKKRLNKLISIDPDTVEFEERFV